MPTAAIVIIGNEILSGKFADENGPFLIRRLRELGVDLLRIVVVPDVIDVIADEVCECAARFDHVLTTGGVGPTHDDQTFPALAHAFNMPLHRHPVLEQVLVAKLGERANEAAMRMAEIPEGAQLWWDGNVIYPLVVVRNVLVFPGVPSLVKLKFEAIAHRFVGVPVECRKIVTERGEPEIADALSDAAGQWPDVAIGSYPRFEERPPVVIITMEGRDLAAIAACEAFLMEHLPA